MRRYARALLDLRPQLAAPAQFRVRPDRLGRSPHHPIATVTELAARGGGFENVTEAIDAGTASGKLVFNIFASLADFERHLISDRTRAGLSAARARGRMGGRPPALSPRQIREARLLLTDPEVTVTAVAARYGDQSYHPLQGVECQHWQCRLSIGSARWVGNRLPDTSRKTGLANRIAENAHFVYQSLGCQGEQR